MKDIHWFKQNVEPLLRGYNLEYRSFKDGDFGDLDQVGFDADTKSGEVDFWSSGVLEIHFIEVETGEFIMNYLMFEDEQEEQEKRLAELIELLKKDLKDNV